MTPSDADTPPLTHVHDGEWCRACLSHGADTMLAGVAEAERQHDYLRAASHAALQDIADNSDDPASRNIARTALSPIAAPSGAGEALAEAQATIEAMSGDAADLHDLIGEAAAMRTVLGHLLNDRGRIHDSGCGTCDAGRALLTADHELPSFSAPAAR